MLKPLFGILYYLIPVIMGLYFLVLLVLQLLGLKEWLGIPYVLGFIIYVISIAPIFSKNDFISNFGAIIPGLLGTLACYYGLGFSLIETLAVFSFALCITAFGIFNHLKKNSASKK